MGYRRRRGYSRSSYGTERAKRHIQEARAFSHEVGHADEAIKAAFFRLSGRALNYLLDKYGEIYGDAARDYARDTIPKWRLGTVQMSGMVAQRLFDLLPPYMSAEDKNKIVESIWKWYGPRSSKYFYIGPDTNADAIVADLESYFERLTVLYPIPETLKGRFDWLSDNDAAAKERLLNHFMDRQRETAIASARLNIPMMLASMKTDAEGKISKLSHTVFVGNHQVEIKADILRSGFISSDYPNDFVRPPMKVSATIGLGLVAVIVIGFLFVEWLQGGSHASSSSSEHTQSIQQAQPITAQVRPTYGFAPMRTATPVVMQAPTSAPVAGHSALAAPASARPGTARADAEQTSRSGTNAADACEVHAVAAVNGNGSEIVLSDGSQYTVSEGVMRLTAAGWVTGDQVQACVSPDGASLKQGYETVQASEADSITIEEGSCRPLVVGYTTPDGSEIGMTDGSTFQLVENGVSRLTAAAWTTGERLDICTAKQNGVWYAGIRAGYQKVEATLNQAGSGQAKPTPCVHAIVSGGAGEDGTMRLDDGTFRVANGVMRLTAREMVTGESVTVCTYSSNGTTYASIAESEYQKVQATQVQ